MKTSLVVISLLLATLILNMCTPSKEQAVERLFESYSGSDVPGAAVMIIKNGKPLLIKTFGMANLKTKEPVTRKTDFRLASMTKAFTAMCIMQLVEQEKLSYQTRLTEIFPDFPAYGKRITIRNLLQHTSGLLDYESLVPDTVGYQLKDKDVLQLMKMQDSTYFEPGSTYSYSNTGYAVLAMVVEKISGLPFAEYLKEHIFIPLKMEHTIAYEKGVFKVPQRATGYTVNDSGIVNTDQSVYSAVLGDGGIYSNLNDLFKWDQALYGSSLVSDSSLQKAFTPNKETYGFGWRIDVYKGHRRYHHNGSTSGFRNTIQRYPDDHFTVIILTNRAAPGVQPLAEQLADWYLLN